MGGVNHVIVDAGIVHIINGYRNITTASPFRWCIFLDILYLVQKNGGKLGFQNMVTCLLQSGVQRENNIVARRRLHPVAGFHHLTHIIYIYGLGAFFTLQLHLHGGFNPGFADGVI